MKKYLPFSFDSVKNLLNLFWRDVMKNASINGNKVCFLQSSSAIKIQFLFLL